jgi:hypothetical protein
MWNHDMTTAPRGRTVTVMRNTKTKDGVIRVPVQEFEPEHVWLASSCGKVIRSYWIPANKNHDGYWPGFAQKGGTQPIAWQPFVTPVHPFASNERGEREGQSLDGGLNSAGANTGGDHVTDGENAQPENAGEPVSRSPALIEHKHIFLDDCGSGA